LLPAEIESLKAKRGPKAKPKAAPGGQREKPD
jgi:hypothetical protein